MMIRAVIDELILSALSEEGLVAQRPSESVVGKEIEAGDFKSQSPMQIDKANDGCSRPTTDCPFQTEPNTLYGASEASVVPLIQGIETC